MLKRALLLDDIVRSSIHNAVTDETLYSSALADDVVLTKLMIKRILGATGERRELSGLESVRTSGLRLIGPDWVADPPICVLSLELMSLHVGANNSYSNLCQLLEASLPVSRLKRSRHSIAFSG